MIHFKPSHCHQRRDAAQLNMYSARLPSSTPGSMILGYAYSPWDTATQVRGVSGSGCVLAAHYLYTQSIRGPATWLSHVDIGPGRAAGKHGLQTCIAAQPPPHDFFPAAAWRGGRFVRRASQLPARSDASSIGASHLSAGHQRRGVHQRPRRRKWHRRQLRVHLQPGHRLGARGEPAICLFAVATFPIAAVHVLVLHYSCWTPLYQANSPEHCRQSHDTRPCHCAHLLLQDRDGTACRCCEVPS